MADAIDSVRFSRVVRTATSENYVILNGDSEVVGALDLHYVGSTGIDRIYGSVILLGRLEQEEEEQVVRRIHEEIVESFASDWTQAEVVLEVYVGRHVATYPDVDDYEDDYGDTVGDDVF